MFALLTEVFGVSFRAHFCILFGCVLEPLVPFGSPFRILWAPFGAVGVPLGISGVPFSCCPPCALNILPPDGLIPAHSGGEWWGMGGRGGKSAGARDKKG